MRPTAACLALLVSLGCAATNLKPKTPGELWAYGTPRLTVWDQGRGSLFMLTVEIPQPTPEFFCPEIHVEVTVQRNETDQYGNPMAATEGVHVTQWTHQADCEPYTLGGWRRVKDPKTGVEAVEPIPPTAFHPHRRTMRLGPGRWIFTVTATQGAVRRIQRVECQVMGG